MNFGGMRFTPRSQTPWNVYIDDNQFLASFSSQYHIQFMLVLWLQAHLKHTQIVSPCYLFNSLVHLLTSLIKLVIVGNY